jgi:hypothetical protein
MTAEEESRRRKVERKMDEARQVDYRDLRYYEMKARQEQEEIGRIGAVSRKLKAEWAFVAEDDFNAVALALSLLDESSMGANRREFESTKRLTQEALQGTVDGRYSAKRSLRWHYLLTLNVFVSPRPLRGFCHSHHAPQFGTGCDDRRADFCVILSQKATRLP